MTELVDIGLHTDPLLITKEIISRVSANPYSLDLGLKLPSDRTEEWMFHTVRGSPLNEDVVALANGLDLINPRDPQLNPHLYKLILLQRPSDAILSNLCNGKPWVNPPPLIMAPEVPTHLKEAVGPAEEGFHDLLSILSGKPPPMDYSESEIASGLAGVGFGLAEQSQKEGRNLFDLYAEMLRQISSVFTSKGEGHRLKFKGIIVGAYVGAVAAGEYKKAKVLIEILPSDDPARLELEGITQAPQK